MEVRRSTILALAFISLLSANSLGQRAAAVKKVSLSTADGIVVEAKLIEPSNARTDGLAFEYTLINRGSKPVFVLNPLDPIIARHCDLGIVEVAAGVIYPADHVEFPYELISVLPNNQIKRRVSADLGHLLENLKLGIGNWRSKLSISYLFDKTDLLGCNKAIYNLPCLSALYRNASTVHLGEFTFSIK